MEEVIKPYTTISHFNRNANSLSWTFSKLSRNVGGGQKTTTKLHFIANNYGLSLTIALTPWTKDVPVKK